MDFRVGGGGRAGLVGTLGARALEPQEGGPDLSGYAAAGALILAGTVVAGTQAHHYARKQVQNRHEQIPLGPGAFELNLQGRYFYVYTPEGLEVWSIQERRQVSVIRNADEKLTWPALSPDGRLLAGYIHRGTYLHGESEDIGLVRVEDAGSERVLRAARGVSDPEWNPNGSLLATAGPEAIQVGGCGTAGCFVPSRIMACPSAPWARCGGATTDASSPRKERNTRLRFGR